MFKTLLEQHFGSSRFAMEVKLKHIYSADGYDCEVDSYDVRLDALADCEMPLFDAVDYLNRPALPEFVAKNIARLRVAMARRGESNEDLAILIDTYARHLSEFPPDVVQAVCDQIIENEKWFPLISEMRKRMLGIVKMRRAVKQCFEEKRNPLLAGQAAARRIASDPRLNEHWKTLSKKDWLPQHYEWAYGEVEDMLALARQNPAIMDVALWEAEAAKRKAEWHAACKAFGIAA